MPLGPHQIAKEIDPVDREFLWVVFSEIDSKLRNSKWVKDWRCGGVGPLKWWNFPFTYELSPYQKEAIAEAYKKAGWTDVQVTNSSEKGERPGVSVVRLIQST